MPTFIKSRKDYKKLYGKNTFCIKIYLKLMDVWCYPFLSVIDFLESSQFLTQIHGIQNGFVYIITSFFYNISSKVSLCTPIRHLNSPSDSL
ncbi:hypothetical protein EXW29_30545 (plasmid) [Bacillus toyonensis]|nr:hypothetical protein EXW29_30545 [Bacillus toyonensis]QWI35594.1 hypothetical protein EXW25_30525 [Bacillus toyonensis]